MKFCILHSRLSLSGLCSKWNVPGELRAWNWKPYLVFKYRYESCSLFEWSWYMLADSDWQIDQSVTVSVLGVVSYLRCFVDLYKMVDESLLALSMTMKYEDHCLGLIGRWGLLMQNNLWDWNIVDILFTLRIHLDDSDTGLYSDYTRARRRLYKDYT